MKNSGRYLWFVRLAISGCVACPALAQTESPPSRQAIEVTPRVKLTETWSDNVAVGGSQRTKESGLISELAPGIRIDAKTARLKAYFDYALAGQFYTTQSGSSRTRNALNTIGTLEALSDWLFLDFSGLISQQAISAFGPQSPSDSNLNTNSTETSTYRLSPYIRGNIAGIIDYSLRYNWSTTQSNASVASNVDLSSWAGQLSGGTPFQNLKWSIDASQQTSTYSQGRVFDAERLYGMATYTIVPQFRISLSGGTESNNYASLEKQSHPTHGYGFDWTPTERTNISVFKERRFFGDGHKYSFSHRFPLSNIRYSDTKNVSVLPNQQTTIGRGTVFDLFYPIFYQICSQNSDLSSRYSDLNACAEAQIQQLPIPPNTQVTSDFLRSRATLQRTQQLAMAFQGTRNTLTVMFTRSQSESMLAFTAIGDDFSQNSINSIRQRGIAINLSHRLSSLANVNLMASRQQSTGSGSSALKASTSVFQAGLTSPLGAKTTGGISVRRSEFDSTSNPYTENAIIGTVSVIF